ncbi:MAG TPA: CHASE2 domain-containing protein [Terriglobales bacterium]|nr:CHASE2 domain-containing protein [Terriglobales bacterium]
MTGEGPQRGTWKTTLARSAALFVLIAALSAIRLIHDFQQRLTDTFFRVTPAPAEPSKVVLVLIDDESLQHYGRWPWSRVLLAQLAHNLAGAGAAVIGLDILLSEPQSPEADAAISQALKESGRAVLADKIGSFPDGPHWIEPLPEFSAAALAVGHVHAPLDADSVCRSFPARELSIDGSRWAFAVEVARHAAPRATSAFLSSYGVPSTDDAAAISFAKPILIPIAYRRDRFEELSARTALQGTDLARVRGRPVLVGLGTMETSDRLTTPLSTEFPTPGVEVHAQILDSILTGRKLYEVPLWLSGSVLFLTCVLVVVVFRRWRGWSATAALALMGVVVYVLAWLAFRTSFLLPTGSMMLAVIAGPLLIYTGDLVLVERSLTQQMRGLRSWLAQQSNKDISPERSDLSWKLGLLQELQTELGSLYELHKTLLESTQDLVAIFNERGELLLQNQALAQACPADARERLSLNQLQSRWTPSDDAPLAVRAPGKEGEVHLGGQLYSVRIVPMPPTALSPGGGTIVTLASLKTRVERDHARAEALGFITHELRTPLSSIQGFAQLMMRYPSSPDCERAPETIYWESKRLLALINSYLDVLRLDAGAKSVAQDVVELGDLVQRVFDILRPLAAAAKMQFVMHSQESITIIADASLLHGAVLNLVSNAIKYGKPGTEIRVTCFRDQGDVAVGVRNLGAPIPPESLARLFDAYYRAPDVEKSRAGWGLGLAFVKRIAEKHGGSIRAESLAAGNLFELRLPNRTKI